MATGTIKNELTDLIVTRKITSAETSIQGQSAFTVTSNDLIAPDGYVLIGVYVTTNQSAQILCGGAYMVNNMAYIPYVAKAATRASVIVTVTFAKIG